MKKNLIIGISACALAVGSAFATLVPETVYVKAKISASQTSFLCEQTSVQCGNNSLIACQIRVTTTIPGGGSKIVNGRRNSLECTTVLTGGDLIIAQNVFHDVQ